MALDIIAYKEVRRVYPGIDFELDEDGCNPEPTGSFTDVHIGDHVFFACGHDDVQHSQFTANGRNGKSPLVYCAALLSKASPSNTTDARMP